MGKIRGYIKAVIAIILIALIAGAYWYSKSISTVKTLTVGVFAESNWNVPNSEPHAILEAAIAKFQAEHPDIKVQFVSGIPKNDYKEWLAGRILEGKEPDLYIVASEQFSDYASIGALMDITDLVEGDRSFSKDVYYPAAMESTAIDGKYYGLPLECVPTLMFVNKTLLQQNGIPIPKDNWTWMDFYDICQQVTRDTNGDGKLDTFGSYGYTWRQAALNNGIDIFNVSRTNPYFTSEAMEETVQMFAALNALNRGYTVSSRDFDLGKVAFRPFTFAEYRTYQPYPWHIKKYSGFEWDIVKFPAGPSGHNVSPVDTLVMAISSRSQQQYMAWAFLKEMSYDKDIQMMILEKSQGMPVRQDILDSEECQELFERSMDSNGNMTLSVIDSVMAEAVPIRYSQRYHEVMLKADDVIRSIISDNISIDNALNRLQKEINIY